MSMEWRWAILGVGFGLSLLGLGFLGSLVAERVRFDHQRLAILNRYDEALKNWHAYPMGLEKGVLVAAEATEDPRTLYIRRVDEALAHNDTRAAEAAWRQAYLLAVWSERWEALVEAGDLALQIGQAAGARKAAEPQARQAYLRALVRARAQRSIDGVLRATEAFARLGDREVAEYGLRIAEGMAARPHAPRMDALNLDVRLSFGFLDGAAGP